MINPEQPKAPEVYVRPKEKYRGEFSLDAEVKRRQIDYYTWGALFFQVTLITFFISIGLMVTSIVLTLLGLWYVNDQLKDFRIGY